MTDADNKILDYLAGHDLEDFEQPPSAIAANIPVSAGHVRKRVLTLRDAGLIEQGDKSGTYRLTDLGKRYLENDLSDEEYRELQEFGLEPEDDKENDRA